MPKYTNEQIARLLADHPRKEWYQRIPLGPGIETPGIYDGSITLKLMGMPESLEGQRVLDIGPAEGYFSFVCERRGAREVVATDYNNAEHTGFSLVADILDSRVQHKVIPMYEMRASELGTFDVVLFLGLLYHLPDPMLGLRMVRALCKTGGLMFVESQVLYRECVLPDSQRMGLPEDVWKALDQVPLMHYFPARVLNPQDDTNYWAPNAKCLELMLADANFEVLHMVSNPTNANRLIVKCRAVEPRGRDDEIRKAYGRLFPQ